MRTSLRTALMAGLCLLPVPAFAQMFVEEPAYLGEEPLVIQEPSMAGEPTMLPSGLVEEDAVAIAMLNGLVSVDEVDEDWNGDYKVDGNDASGDDIEMTIDGETGEVLDVDN